MRPAIAFIPLLSITLVLTLASAGFASPKPAFTSEKTPFETLAELYQGAGSAHIQDLPEITASARSGMKTSNWLFPTTELKDVRKADWIGRIKARRIIPSQPGSPGAGPIFPGTPGTPGSVGQEYQYVVTCANPVRPSCEFTDSHAFDFDAVPVETSTEIVVYNRDGSMLFIRKSGDLLVLRGESGQGAIAYSYAWPEMGH